ncbi:MAG TPA: NAD(P)-dependent oxidoreductase [Mariniphaga sp.]|nr:NAD(P)-dependent oxidoreductase [Mariniphaga sp.]
MKKILIATEKPFAPIAIKKIRKIFDKAGKNYELKILENYLQKDELKEAVADANAIIIRSDIIDAEIINAASNLKIIVRAGAGYDNIEMDAATAKGIVVMNTPGQNSNAVAELAIGLAIFGLREMFSGKPGGELRGKTLGLHGFGYVARNVYRIAKAFGMKVIVYTRYSKTAAIAAGLKVTGSLEELYEKSDVVSIHVPARGEHIKSVSYEVLKHLKDEAVIVNTARKEVVNEPDLIRIMQKMPGIKYMSDLTPDNKIEFEEHFKGRYFFTPKKAGAQTAEANINAGVAAARQIVDFFEKGNVEYQVNKW